MCIAQSTIVAHNATQNTPDYFPSYPSHNHHCSDDVKLREGSRGQEERGGEKKAEKGTETVL